MGIVWPDIAFLLTARRLGADFDRTLTLGRQDLFVTPEDLERAVRDAGVSLPPTVLDDKYADSLLRELGAIQLDSLDASAYEGSTLVHDLNEPLPSVLLSRYSLVIDGGSLEHVFNFPQAIKNAMQAVAPGGHFVAITPVNNYAGHGFYQFSPELFYRVLSPENGYRVKLMAVRTRHRWARWFQVANPAEVGHRVTLTNAWPSMLFVLAERVAEVEPLATTPQQSDYAMGWAAGAAVASGRRVGLAERLPAPLRRTARVASAFIGAYSEDFRRIELSRQ